MSSLDGKWSYSFDEEYYHEGYETADEAMKAGVNNAEGGDVFIGQYRQPYSPEKCFDIEDLFDQIMSHEDYAGEWSESFFDIPDDVEKQFTEEMQKQLGVLFDKYELRPKFGLIKPETVKNVIREEK